ncbi:MAG: hypothetical protein WCH97_06500, partial [Actinomycetes bacterium]
MGFRDDMVFILGKAPKENRQTLFFSATLSPEVKKLGKAEEIEMRIVASGARRDLGEIDAAVVTLTCKELTNEVEEWAVRLRYAYADALAAAGRDDEAKTWFAKCAEVDSEEFTDASERAL